MRLLLTILGYCLHGLCTFPNMVSSANIAKNLEKKEKKRTDMMQTVMDNAEVVFTWSVYISKYGNQRKYSHKVRGKKMRKRVDTQTLLLTMLVHCSCGLCTFPNMAINANIARKSGEKRQKKSRHDVDCC